MITEGEKTEKQAFDINQPGLLIHGAKPYDLDRILIQGLKPRNSQDRIREDGFTVVPDYISLSMVGAGISPSKAVATFMYGASDDTFNRNITLIIDPEYVKSHANDFKAVGSSFSPDNHGRDLYCDSDDQIYNGIEYEEVETNHYGQVFADEVLTRFIPPEAIIGIVTRAKHFSFLKEDLKRIAPERKILIFDTNGNLLD